MSAPITQPPPFRGQTLGLVLELPPEAFQRLTRGYEAQTQDDKWSLYFHEPWLQIWRPNRNGWYCYAVRFEEGDRGWFQVSESWVSDSILSSLRGLGPDLQGHRKTARLVIETIAKYFSRDFHAHLVSGSRDEGAVTFHGKVSNAAEVEIVAEELRRQVRKLQTDSE